MSNYQEIPLSNIKESPLNPRKHFDESAIKELASSIAEIGVIQPIVVRPKDKNFELVCGARRFRASKLAKTQSISAVIRELTDEEALELMITENLQRKDVHPLDEAAAIQSLQKTGKTQEDIAAKLGVSQAFIAKRLKLLDLEPDLQKAYFENRITNQHAVDLCRIGARDQNEIYTSIKTKIHKDDHNPKKLDLNWEINRSQKLMSNAVFDTKDANLVPKAGACSTCSKNTACSTVLFPEFAEKPRCMDTECWEAKEEIHLQRVLEDPFTVVLLDSWNNDEKLIKLAKKLGKAILPYNSWEKTNSKNGALGITAHDKTIIRFIPVTSAGSIPKTEITKHSTPMEISLEIERLTQRESRAKELDWDKEQASLIEAFEESASFKSLTSFREETFPQQLREGEKAAFLYAVYCESGHGTQDQIDKALGIKTGRHGNDEVISAMAQLSEADHGLFLVWMLRRMVMNKFTGSSWTGINNGTRATRLLTKSLVPDEKQKEIEQALQAKIKRRQESLDKRLKELKLMLQAKQDPEQKAKPVPKKSTLKKGLSALLQN